MNELDARVSKALVQLEEIGADMSNINLVRVLECMGAYGG